MESNSPQRNRKPRSGSSQNRNRNRSGGNRNSNRSGGRRRRPEPKPTGFQKFIKAITFGLVDPAKKKRKGRKSTSKKPRDRRRIIEDPTTPRLYVGNLSYDLSDEELEKAFQSVGKVASAAVVRHGDSGRSKGFGFVEMGSVEEARAAVSKLNDKELKGRQLLVSGAKAEKPRREGRPEREGGRGERSKREERGERPPRREGRSGDRRSRDRRGGRSDDRVEKPARQVRPPKIEVVTSPRLLVSNLNKDASEVDIADLFDGIGELREKSSIEVKGDSATGEMTVEFAETEAAQKAVEVIDMKFFMGHQLRLKGLEGASEEATQSEDGVEEESPSDSDVAVEEDIKESDGESSSEAAEDSKES